MTGNDNDISIIKCLKLLYLLFIYTKPRKDIFENTKYKICQLLLKYNNYNKNKIIDCDFTTLDNSIATTFDMLLFVQKFGNLKCLPSFENIYDNNIVFQSFQKKPCSH